VKASAPLAQALCDSARIVARVAKGKSLTAEFGELREASVATPRAALMDLCYGTLRRYGRVQAIVRALSKRGAQDPQVEALLWCALYALESTRYEEHTVVDQAVGACGLLEKWNAKGYVNALLRGYLRGHGSLSSRIENEPEARHQHPAWWIDAVKAAHPGQWEAVLAAGNQHPPMCLRVNLRRQSVDAYAGRLREAGIEFRPVGASGLVLEKPLPTERLPGFSEGDVSIQDAGAQRAAFCLDLADGQRVLDACAAPGGKSAHMLERAELDLTCLDSDSERCAVVARTLERLKLKATVVHADCTKLEEWWDGRPFDRILADVPCTASGVVRRHPDLKWLRRAQDVEAFAGRQGRILDALWQVLAPDGKLLYATCSVFPRENEEVVQAFAARTSGARRLPLPDGGAAQRLPAAEQDGFYFALLARQA
jgi:16S rRNA (cytosine967-C5)-methyltransferase